MIGGRRENLGIISHYVQKWIVNTTGKPNDNRLRLICYVYL